MEVPDAGAHVGIDLIDASQARERKSDGVIAHHLGAVAGHITHGAAVGRGRRDIDVVHAGAGLADHLQLGERRKHLGGEAPVGGDGPIGSAQMLDDLGRRTVAGIVEALELDARGLHHLPLEVAIAEIEVRHHDELP